MLPTRRIITLLLLSLYLRPLNAQAEKTVALAIERGEKYLINAVIENKYGLQCIGVTTQNITLPCPYNDAGLPVTSFFIAQALHNSTYVPQTVRTTLLSALDKEEQRLDPFYWGSTNPIFWGYTRTTPPDSDDTSFVLRTFLLLGKTINLSGLNEFYDVKRNAYVTFRGVTAIASVPLNVAPANNIEQPPETNANIFALFQTLHLPEKVNYKLVTAFQNVEGYWSTYFYPGKYYSTYMNMSVLCVDMKHQKEINLGLNFIFGAQNQNGSWGNPGNAYETALALNTLLACHEKKSAATEKGLKYLLKAQAKSGYWTNVQPVWEYWPTAAIRHIAFDRQHIIGTALAVYALKQYEGLTDSNRAT